MPRCCFLQLQIKLLLLPPPAARLHTWNTLPASTSLWSNICQKKIQIQPTVPILSSRSGWLAATFMDVRALCRSWIRINPYVLEWVGVELELNSTPIHFKTYGFR
jgi:hypothetical protein